MRMLLVHQLAASPWMNPGRWTDRPAAGVPPDAGADRWQRDQYTALLATGTGAAAAAERARAAVLAYQLFPPDHLIAAMPSLRVAPESIIVQGFRLGPLGLIAAIKVLTVFDRSQATRRRTGFSAVTVAGHPARGAITIAIVEETARQQVHVEIDSISQPGHWLARLAAPVTRALQRRSNQAILGHLQALAQGAGVDRGAADVSRA